MFVKLILLGIFHLKIKYLDQLTDIYIDKLKR